MVNLIIILIVIILLSVFIFKTTKLYLKAQQIESKINILEQGISLNEYLEIRDDLKGKDIFEFGRVVIVNETKGRYQIVPYGLDYTVGMFTGESGAHGIRYDDYMEQDHFVVKFHPLGGSGCFSFDKLEKHLEKEYDKSMEPYWSVVERLDA